MKNRGPKGGSEGLRGFFLYTVIFTSFLVLGGCTATVNKIQDLQQMAIMSMRKPGDKMVASPEKTAETHSCVSYRHNKLVLEDAEVIPSRVSPGDEVNQRVRYGFCPYTPSGTAQGKIIRTVLFKGETMFQDVTDYEFKPGTWAVDAFIAVPRDAQGGVYAIDVVLRYGRETIKRSNTFVVEGE